MKINQATLSILLGIGLASSASAVNFVYVTGSTAFRSAAFNGLTNSFDSVPQIATRDGSAASGNNANWMLFHGNVGGVETWVDCHWSGSEDGIAGVAVPGSNPTYFLKTDEHESHGAGSGFRGHIASGFADSDSGVGQDGHQCSPERQDWNRAIRLGQK